MCQTFAWGDRLLAAPKADVLARNAVAKLPDGTEVQLLGVMAEPAVGDIGGKYHAVDGWWSADGKPARDPRADPTFRSVFHIPTPTLDVRVLAFSLTSSKSGAIETQGDIPGVSPADYGGSYGQGVDEAIPGTVEAGKPAYGIMCVNVPRERRQFSFRFGVTLPGETSPTWVRFDHIVSIPADEVPMPRPLPAYSRTLPDGTVVAVIAVRQSRYYHGRCYLPNGSEIGRIVGSGQFDPDAGEIDTYSLGGFSIILRPTKPNRVTLIYSVHRPYALLTPARHVRILESSMHTMIDNRGGEFSGVTATVPAGLKQLTLEIRLADSRTGAAETARIGRVVVPPR